jgi:3-isopropylmalate dehydrogenase
MPSQSFNIAVLAGDGVGPEVTAQAVRVLRTAGDLCGMEFQFHDRAIGGAAINAFDDPLPEDTLRTCLDSNAVLLGAVGGPDFDCLPANKRPESGLLRLRQELGGFANIRPAKFYPQLASASPLRADLAKGADIVIVRELLGGLYFGEPRGFSPGEPRAAFNTMRYSESEVERVARIAFETARTRRKKLTSVDKANVLETSRLWREVLMRVGEEYSDVALDHVYVDACAMYLVTQPARFDVIVTENLFGDILSDEAAALTGTLGMQPSATLGGTVDLYEPVHGSAPDIAGNDIANPLGAIGSAAMMLRHTFRLEQVANDLEAAIQSALDAGHRTADIRRGMEPAIGTAAMGEVVDQAFADRLHRNAAYHAV